MNNSVIRRVVLLGAAAIVGIIVVQSYWVMRAWDVQERAFSQTVNIVLRRVAEAMTELNDGTLPESGLIKRASANSYVVNINGVVHAGALEYFLMRELGKAGLQVDFEYGIYDCASDDMVSGNYCNFSPDAAKRQVDLDKLPKTDEFTYYFGVKFPSYNRYVLGEMQLLFVFTVILLTAVLFFIYSMMVILRQKRLSEMQKDFINNMTHEFKTPISTIKVSAEVFLNSELVKGDSRLKRYAEIIRAQNQRLNRQVEKVLQLAKVERGSFLLNLEEVDVHDLLKGILPDIEPKMTELGGVVEHRFLAENPCVQADRLHLTNILHNLLDNAMKYSKEGGPKVQVGTHTAPGGRLALRVADEGIGMSKEHQSKVFDKFYRVPTGNVHNVKGFGLGLFYVKNICDAHGWRLRLDSQPAEGTAISIWMK